MMLLGKCPKTFPVIKKKTFTKLLGKPLTTIPDPFEKEESYAAYFEKQMENSIKKVNVCPEFLYQSRKYLSGQYNERIKFVLKKTLAIREILNKFRSSPLKADWYPITIFCKKCHCSQTKVNDYDGEDSIVYFCEGCSKKFTLDLNKDYNLKLLWRVDWPMRWEYEKVDFEPGGKDHSTEGGSYDTAKLISREIFNYEPPVYLQYDFVLTKGRKSKLSSSTGEVITVDDLLEIYQPEIVRWVFASYKNNVDFSIAFDLDVIKIYEAYDRMERQFYQKEAISPSKAKKNNFVFELSQLKNDFHKEKIQQFPFRHLANISQINEFSPEKIKKQLNEKEEIDLDSFPMLETRLLCVKNWIGKYAPKSFKFLLNKHKVSLVRNHLKDAYNYKRAFSELKEVVANEAYKNSDKEMANYLYVLIDRHGLEAGEFLSKFTCYSLTRKRDLSWVIF